MGLAMKHACERCDRPLRPGAADARICSYECTYCAACAGALAARCPNCNGELVARPRRDERPPCPPESPVPGE